MPIKRLFNQNENHEKLLHKIAELEKRQLRFNTLEVQIKRLLNLEGKLLQQSKLKDSEEIPPTKHHRKSKSDIEKKRLPTESTVLRKIAPYIQQIDVMNKQVLELEKNISILKQAQLKIQEVFVSETPSMKKLAPFFKKIDWMEQKVIEFEKDLTELNQTQVQVNDRLEQIEERLFNLEGDQQEEKKSEQAVVIKEIHVDKFYLDKYEQHNNFAQLGIKSLSGSLNIGATYGTGAIPKEFTDQIKEDINEMKGMKKEFDQLNENEEGNTEIADNESSSSSGSSESNINEEHFIEIPIEVFPDEESGND